MTTRARPIALRAHVNTPITHNIHLLHPHAMKGMVTKSDAINTFRLTTRSSKSLFQKIGLGVDNVTLFSFFLIGR